MWEFGDLRIIVGPPLLSLISNTFKISSLKTGPPLLNLIFNML